MLDNAVAVTSGKGGVLKTSLSCHLAGIAASHGWKVLLVDADPQGNAMFDLGYPSDGGVSLAAALVDGVQLQPLASVRPNLDVVCGGPALDKVAYTFRDEPCEWTRLKDALARLATNYDLVVIDSPARELWIRHMILTAARFLVIPSSVDRASRVGLPDAAATINEVRAATNPGLEVLAVVTGPIPVTSTQIRQRARQRLGDLIGDHDLVCETIIRRADLVAEHCREYGLLSHEYATLEHKGSAAGSKQDLNASGSATVSQAADGVSEDWQRLIGELLTRYRHATDQPPGQSRRPVA